MTNNTIESAVFEILDRTEIPYEVMDCEPHLADTANFCQHYKIPPSHSGNCIVVATKKEPKRYCACVVTATTRLDVNKTVKKLLGGKCSFASSEDTKRLTGMMIGGVTPFAIPKDWALYIDSRIMDLDTVILGGGSRSKKIKITPKIFEATPNTHIVEGLAKG
jgi:prolyl-tRNA editing enzyme YbaK/EbsC (Cys-tRNA(Pro) deacylase)